MHPREPMALQTVPADKSVLGTGMERDPEPLLPAAPTDLLLDASAVLCVCLSGEGSSSMIGLQLPMTVMQAVWSSRWCGDRGIVSANLRHQRLS